MSVRALGYGLKQSKVSWWSWLPFVLACSILFTAATLAWPGAFGAARGLWRETSNDPGTAASNAGSEPSPGAATAVRPVSNDCSGGTVYFTFDDGPAPSTVAVLDRLKALNIKATFFVIGDHIQGRQDILRREVSEGHSVQNHTYHHPNLVTGVDVNGVQRQPWGDSQIETEFERANTVIVAAGAPRPTQYRPPYGSVNNQVDGIAGRLGLRLIMSWGDSDADNIVDSRDTERDVTADSIAHNVAASITANSIISMHDGEDISARNDIQSLQSIVDAMNAKHLCASTRIRSDATGNVLH
ncbi:MAG TPA: polysaccharide deacetylase family protein [Pseudonocardiaceae bacterium]|jgi:peptidoglycan/xylan/chitin deacetylase (PgdA/CDA1 family)|nr:polysaccharide deacetylase family protein [Pseudonocardiaceae bacterium]